MQKILEFSVLKAFTFVGYFNIWNSCSRYSMSCWSHLQGQIRWVWLQWYRGS